MAQDFGHGGARPCVRDTARYNLARAPAFARRHDERGKRNAPSLCKDAPDNGAYLGLLAKIRAERGQKPDALREAKEALEKDRGDVNAWLRLVRLTGESGDLEGAFGLLEQAAQRPERKPLEARKALAQARLGRGDEAGALRDLKAWATGDAREAEYPLMLARLHEGRGRSEEALEWCKRLKRVDWKAGGLALVRFTRRGRKLKRRGKRPAKCWPGTSKTSSITAFTPKPAIRLACMRKALEAVEKGPGSRADKFGALRAENQYAAPGRTIRGCGSFCQKTDRA